MGLHKVQVTVVPLLLSVKYFHARALVTLGIMVLALALVDMLAYMQKMCDVAEKAMLAKKNLRKKCVNRDKSA